MTHINYTVIKFRNVQMGHHELVGKEKVNKELEHGMVQGDDMVRGHDMVQGHGMAQGLENDKQGLGDMGQGMDDKEQVDDRVLVHDTLGEAHDILAFLVVGRAWHIHVHYGKQLLQNDRKFLCIH